MLAFFEATEIDARTGETLSIFRTDSRGCALHEAFESISEMIGANLSTTSYFELRRYATMPADWHSFECRAARAPAYGELS